MVKQMGSTEEFNTIIKGDKPVIVDFTASWCGPCKMIAPFFAQLAETYPTIEFIKVRPNHLNDRTQVWRVVYRYNSVAATRLAIGRR